MMDGGRTWWTVYEQTGNLVMAIGIWKARNYFSSKVTNTLYGSLKYLLIDSVLNCYIKMRAKNHE